MKLQQWIICLIAGLFSISAFAQYVGPNQKVTMTVANAQKAADDTPVMLEGYITNQVRRKHYEFKDATGTLILEIDKAVVWPARITEKDKVRIYGETDKEIFGSNVKVEVDRIELIAQSPR